MHHNDVRHWSKGLVQVVSFKLLMSESSEPHFNSNVFSQVVMFQTQYPVLFLFKILCDELHLKCVDGLMKARNVSRFCVALAE